MPLLPCDGLVWRDGRVSKCVQLQFLGFLVPIAACVVSVAILVGRLVWDRRRAARDLRTKLMALSARAVALPDGYDGDEDEAESEERDQREEYGGLAAANQPRFIAGGCRLFAAVEGLALATDMAINGAFIILVSRSRHDYPEAQSSLVAIMSSAYLLLLVLLRSWVGEASPGLFCALRSHSTAIYSVQWLCALVSAHSILVGQVGMPHTEASLLRVAVFSLLILLHATASRHMTKPLCDNGLDMFAQPAPEETASLASRLTVELDN